MNRPYAVHLVRMVRTAHPTQTTSVQGREAWRNRHSLCTLGVLDARKFLEVVRRAHSYDKKLVNAHEGWQPKDDWLPERLLSETLPTGVAQGIGLTPDDLRQMIQSYYEARG